MGSAKYFTSIDLCSGYWQCFISGETTLKTAFLVRYSLYKWVVMPMELTNAPDTFIQTINGLSSNMLDSGMPIFLGDILVYLCTVKEHFTLLEQVLLCLHQYTFTPESMCISDLKVQNLNEWPVTTTGK